MKWINHKITTFAVVYLFTRDALASIIAAMGSTIPDMLEGYKYDATWRKRHRRTSHWLFGYFLISVLTWIFIRSTTGINLFSLSLPKMFSTLGTFNPDLLTYVIAYVCFYIGIGALLHVLEDSLSGAVPLLHPTRRVFSIGIIKVGSMSEYVIAFGLLLVSLTIVK